MSKALRQASAREAYAPRHFLDGPGMRGVLMHERESLADYGIAGACEPACLAGRKPVDVAAQCLDEQHFRKFGDYHPAPGIRFIPVADREPDSMLKPLPGGFFR